MIKCQITYNCEFCGKEVTKGRSEYKKSKRHFCGHECYVKATKGKNHYNYVGLTIQCDYCGENVDTNQFKLNTYKNHFCNMKCHDKYRKEFGPKGKDHPIYKSIQVECSNCGKKLQRVPYDIKRSDFLYCDRKCMIEHRKLVDYYKGEGNANWRGGNIEVECAICGKKMYRKQCRVRNHNWFVCSPKCRGEYIAKYMRGENSYNWDGGKTELNHGIRTIAKYKDWRKAVYERDGYVCKICERDSNLVAHHIHPVDSILKENNITSKEEAIVCEILWDVNNGVTFCVECHKDIHAMQREYKTAKQQKI